MINRVKLINTSITSIVFYCAETTDPVNKINTVSMSFTLLFIFLDSTYKWHHTVFAFLCWLISRSVMPSMFTHLITMAEFSVLMAEYNTDPKHFKQSIDSILNLWKFDLKYYLYKHADNSQHWKQGLSQISFYFTTKYLKKK